MGRTKRGLRNDLNTKEKTCSRFRCGRVTGSAGGKGSSPRKHRAQREIDRKKKKRKGVGSIRLAKKTGKKAGRRY